MRASRTRGRLPATERVNEIRDTVYKVLSTELLKFTVGSVAGAGDAPTELQIQRDGERGPDGGSYPILGTYPDRRYSAPGGPQKGDRVVIMHIGRYNGVVLGAAGDTPPRGVIDSVQAFEKSPTIPGQSPLAATAHDDLPFDHQSSDIVLAAEATIMQFEVGTDADHVTDTFTVFPAEARALPLNVSFVRVTNTDPATPGGYRVWNLYGA